MLRLERVATDLLLTLNTPVFIHERSASAEHAGAGHRDGAGAYEILRRVLGSLNVVDWGLFGHD